MKGKFVVLAAAAAVYLGGGQHALTSAGSHYAATGSITCNSNCVLANSMAASGYGWTGSETTCLDELWTRENAAWDPTQWNLGGSGAYGIPQALPAAKMASAGPDWQTNPVTQIRWGLRYLKDTYGSPCGGWLHEQGNSWY